MGVSISLANGSNVIVYETPQGGVAFDELDASFDPIAANDLVAAGPVSRVGAQPLSNGGFTVGWMTGGHVMVRDYDASGQPTDQAHPWSGAASIAAAGFSSNAGGATTWLPNGDQVVSSQTSSGASNYQVHLQLYSPQGAPIGPAFSETAPPVSLFDAPVVASLKDGSYEAAWVQQANYSSHLLVEHFTAQGTAAGQATLATTGGFSVIGGSDFALAGLADGGFAAAWTVQDNSGSPAQIYAEEFTASGAPVGSATLLGAAASPTQAPVIDAESNGHYVVSWNSPSGAQHQAFMDPATVAAATPAPSHTQSLASTSQTGADLPGAEWGAEWGGFAWPSAHTALHPLVSAAVALTDASHPIAGLHAAHTPSFSFL